MPEPDWIGQAARGDGMAFAALVREHQSMVYGLARHFLRNQAVAEELSQEVFLHLHRNLASIQSPAHLVFWLRKVTTHRCIDEGRKQRWRFWTRLDDAPEPASWPKSVDPLLSERLRGLVQSLPEKPRAVLLLRYQEDLDPTEIAELLDMPVATVKSHLQRSLALLRTKMERQEGR